MCSYVSVFLGSNNVLMSSCVMCETRTLADENEALARKVGALEERITALEVKRTPTIFLWCRCRPRHYRRHPKHYWWQR